MRKIFEKIKKNKILIIPGLIFFVSLFILSDVSKEQTKTPNVPEDRYVITSSEKPKIREAIFKPLDFVPNEEQIVYVKVENENPIGSVTATVLTDKLEKTYELKLFEGNQKIGTWKGSWRINDSRNYTYRETFKAVSGNDKSKIELYFK